MLLPREGFSGRKTILGHGSTKWLVKVVCSSKPAIQVLVGRWGGLLYLLGSCSAGRGRPCSYVRAKPAKSTLVLPYVCGLVATPLPFPIVATAPDNKDGFVYNVKVVIMSMAESTNAPVCIAIITDQL